MIIKILMPSQNDDHDAYVDHDDDNAHELNDFEDFTYPCQRGHGASTSPAEIDTFGWKS